MKLQYLNSLSNNSQIIGRQINEYQIIETPLVFQIVETRFVLQTDRKISIHGVSGQ